MVEDLNDDDQQLQMALQMSLDEISLAKSKNVLISENSETLLPLKNILKNANTKTHIPVILPKYYQFLNLCLFSCYKHFLNLSEF